MTWVTWILLMAVAVAGIRALGLEEQRDNLQDQVTLLEKELAQLRHGYAKTLARLAEYKEAARERTEATLRRHQEQSEASRKGWHTRRGTTWKT